MSVYSITAVRLYSEMRGDAYILQLMIADGTDATYGYNRGHSVPDLASACHFHEWDATPKERENARRRTIRLLNKLVADGELIIFPGGGARRKSEYVIPILAAEPGYAEQACPEFGQHDASHFCNGRHTSLLVNREQIAVEERNRRKQDHYAANPKAAKSLKRRAVR